MAKKEGNRSLLDGGKDITLENLEERDHNKNAIARMNYLRVTGTQRSLEEANLLCI